MSAKLAWHRVAGLDDLPEGRVKTVTVGKESIALTHHEGRYGALANACPHQGGPLGEGTIEGGFLRCPWHGWDFCPLTGKPPGGYDDGVKTYPVEEREDGVYVAVEEEGQRERTVSDVMAETMVNWGISHVFGMVGHSNLGLADALRVQEEAGRLSYIGIRHEGAAAFAASAYAKLTGRPAACLAIAGPGATNLLTGLWDAKVDRAPLLALTGQVDTQVLGPGAFQELPLAEAFSSVAGWSQTVLPGSRHAELVNLALKHAVQRREVAHLIFPNEVQEIVVGEEPEASGPEGRLTPLDIAPPASALDDAVALVAKAKRPVVVVGYGAREGMAEVVALAERLGAPVLTTFKAKGQISDHHPLGCGVLGRSGTPIASWFMNESDALLVFGASFSNHTGITPKKPTVQVDFDPWQLGRTFAVDVPVLGDIAVTARLLAGRLEGAETEDQRAQVAERWRLWRAEKESRRRDDESKGLGAASVFEAMNRLIPADAVIAVDVGNNTYSFGRYFECREQSVLMSGYLGSIGFGYPAAIGAWAAAGHERPIVAVTGDGGFGQYLAEVTTAVKYGMNLTHILLNNSELGKISKEQRAGHFSVWQTSLHNPDFADYVTLCGGLGIRVTRAEELDAAIERALAYDGPATVEVIQNAALV